MSDERAEWWTSIVAGPLPDLDARDAERGIDTTVAAPERPIRVCKPRPMPTYHERLAQEHAGRVCAQRSEQEIAERRRIERVRLQRLERAARAADAREWGDISRALRQMPYRAQQLECWPLSLTRRQCGLPPIEKD